MKFVTYHPFLNFQVVVKVKDLNFSLSLKFEMFHLAVRCTSVYFMPVKGPDSNFK